MPPRKGTMRDRLEYPAVWLLLQMVSALPRPVACALATGVARGLLRLLPKLRQTAMFNLRLAFPEWSDTQCRALLRKMAGHFGRMAVEFARLPRWTLENAEKLIVLDGQENYLAAKAPGKGTLFLTGHMGAWELSPFGHARLGFPMYYIARPLDNPRLDALVTRYRCLSGAIPIFKNESARAMLKILREAGTIGILADQNTMPEEGVFVDFFGTPACTSTGIARVALHTDASVLPAYIYWDADLGKYCLRFEPPVELLRTGDADRDILENTAHFAKVIEAIIRRHPDQWVWVHARWKTRPPGEPPLYPFLR